MSLISLCLTCVTYLTAGKDRLTTFQNNMKFTVPFLQVYSKWC